MNTYRLDNRPWENKGPKAQDQPPLSWRAEGGLEAEGQDRHPAPLTSAGRRASAGRREGVRLPPLLLPLPLSRERPHCHAAHAAAGLTSGSLRNGSDLKMSGAR